MSTEHLVQIDGMPYVAGTAGASSPVSWETPDDEPRGALILPDALASTRWTIEERLSLAEGDLDVSGLTLELHDIAPSAGIALGRPWLTYLSTRDPRDVPSAVVASSFDAAATSFALTAESASAVASAVPGVLWVDAEAILCDAIDLGTGVVTVAADGRGYYGSRAVSHLIDLEYSVYPEAWTAPPWATQRRVLLWRVGDDGVARVRWRGYARRAPRTSRNRASLQLQCDSAWTVERARPLGARAASTRLRGYSAAGIQLRVVDPRAAWVGAVAMGSWRSADGYTTIYDSLDEWASEARRRLALAISTYGTVSQATVAVQRIGRRVTMRAQIAGLTANAFASAVVLGEETRGTAGDSGASPLRLEVTFDAPECAVVVDASADGSATHTIPVTSATALPSSPTATVEQAFGAHRVVVREVLSGDYDEDLRLVIGSPAATAYDADYTGPIVRGSAALVSKATGQPRPLRKGVAGLTGDAGSAYSAQVLTVDRAVRLALSTEIRATHWAHGIWALITYGERSGCQTDPRNWDLAERSSVISATEGDLASRVWLLDGEQTLGAFLSPTLAAEGCVPTLTTGARIALAAISHPAQTDVPVASFSSDDCVRGTGFEWSPIPEALTSSAKIKVDDDTTLVRDSRSVQRYGETKPRELELTGLPPGLSGADPRSVASRVLSRLVQVWGDPVASVRWAVPLGLADDVRLADQVELSDSVVPNGLGDRGMSSRRAVITARVESTDAGTVSFEAITFPLCYAYAPAARIASISGAELTLATGYVQEGGAGATDFAGGDAASRFADGDRVKLVLFDTTSYVDLPAVVASVNAGAGTITLTASVPTSPTDWPALAVSGWVVLMYDGYEVSGVQATQKRYAVCGGGNTAFGQIGTTGESSRRWAP